MRTANISRNTAETKILVEINLDGTGQYDNKTGIGFFDHMLDQLSRHSLIDIKVHANGDLHIDVATNHDDPSGSRRRLIPTTVRKRQGSRRLEPPLPTRVR